MTEEDKATSENGENKNENPMERMRRLTQAGNQEDKSALNYEHRIKRTSGQTGEWLIFESDREIEDTDDSQIISDNAQNNEKPEWYFSKDGEMHELDDIPSTDRETIPPTISQPTPGQQLANGNSGSHKPFLEQPLDEIDEDATTVTPVAYQISRPVSIPETPKREDVETKNQEELEETPGRHIKKAAGKKPIENGENGNTKKSKKWRPSCLTKILIGLLFVLAMIGIAFMTFFVYKYFSIAAGLPDYSDLSSHASQFETTRILDRNGNLLYEINDPEAGRRRYVTLENISPYLVAATIATEDKEYYNHPGFDPIAITRAMWQNLYRSGNCFRCFNHYPTTCQEIVILTGRAL